LITNELGNRKITKFGLQSFLNVFKTTNHLHVLNISDSDEIKRMENYLFILSYHFIEVWNEIRSILEQNKFSRLIQNHFNNLSKTKLFFDMKFNF